MRGAWSGMMVGALVLGGCGDAMPGAALGSFVVDTLPSGTVVVTNTGEGAWTEAERWRPTVAFEIGSLDAEGPYVFGDINDLEVDAEGNLYVLEGQAREIRVFDRTGTHLRTLSGPGEGPGEFGSAWGMAMGHDGTLWGWDPSLDRLTQFSQDGELLRTVRRGIGGVMYPWPGGFHRDGYLVDRGLERRDGVGDEPRQLVTFFPIRFDLETETPDTTPGVAWATEYEGDATLPLDYQDRRTIAVHVSGDPLFARSRDYQVYRRSMDGDTLLMIRRADVAGPVVTEAEVDSLLGAMEERVRTLGIASDIPSPDFFPPTKAVIKRVVGGRGGEIVVFPWLDGFPPGSVMDVFDGDTGEFRGEVVLPTRVVLDPAPVLAAGSLYAVRLGEYDVPIVVGQVPICV